MICITIAVTLVLVKRCFLIELIPFSSDERDAIQKKTFTKWVNKHLKKVTIDFYPARALGLLLADGTPTGGRGEDFLSRQPDFFTETAVTPERKVEKWFPRWEINRHAEG